jgi:hypothetical protein
MRSTATAEAVAELGLLKNMDLVKIYRALRPMTAIRYSVSEDDPTPNKTGVMWGCLIPIVCILLLPFSGYPIRKFQTSAGKKALPLEASSLEEYLNHGIFGGDFTRLLKATLPAERYTDYAKSLGICQRFDPQVHDRIEPTLNWKSLDAPLWWNPPKVDSTTYFEHKEGDDYLRVLRYHNGSVYLHVQQW